LAPASLTRRRLVLLLISAVVACWITVDVLHHGPWTHLDGSISRTVRNWGLRHRPLPYDAVYALTALGARAAILIAFGPYVLALSIWARSIQPLLRFAVALGLLTGAVYAFKFGVGRSAPVIDAVHVGGESFPSGHQPNAVLMWGLVASLAVEFGLPARAVRILSVLRVVAPGLVFLAMILLDFHWLSDMVAGIAVGIGLLAVMRIVFDGPIGRWGSPRRDPATGQPAVE